jgi:hypothetical protein
MRTSQFDAVISRRGFCLRLLKINSFLLTYYPVRIHRVSFSCNKLFASFSYFTGTSLNSTRATNEVNISLANNNSNSTSSNSNISNNQQHTMQEIDDRLKKEVLSLGLIDQGAVNKIVCLSSGFLFGFVLFWLWDIVSYRIVSYRIVLYRIVLYCIALHCS